MICLLSNLLVGTNHVQVDAFILPNTSSKIKNTMDTTSWHTPTSTLLQYQVSHGCDMPLPQLPTSSDPYAILGLVRHANGVPLSEIKSAYRRAAQLYHPDLRTAAYMTMKSNTNMNMHLHSDREREEKEIANEDLARINAAYGYLIGKNDSLDSIPKPRSTCTTQRATNDPNRSHSNGGKRRNSNAHNFTANGWAYWSHSGTYGGYQSSRKHCPNTRGVHSEAQNSTSTTAKTNKSNTNSNQQNQENGERKVSVKPSFGTRPRRPSTYRISTASHSPNANYRYSNHSSSSNLNINNKEKESESYHHCYFNSKSQRTNENNFITSKYTRTTGANGAYWLRYGYIQESEPSRIGTGPGSASAFLPIQSDSSIHTRVIHR